jgi:S1-C subfamily serine protease
MINRTTINTLDDFVTAITALPDGERASLRYFTMEDPRRSQLKTMYVDRRWFPTRRCQRDDVAGLWNCQDLPVAQGAPNAAGGSARFPKYTDKSIARLAPSLVGIKFDMPYSISGVNERNYHGTGLILDAVRGLVITDRNTVPVSVGDVQLTFAGALVIPAKVVYVHPLHDLAVIQYDPKLIGDTPVVAARLATEPLQTGEAVEVIGMDNTGDMQSRATSIAEVNPLLLPLSRTVQFRDANIEVASLVNPPEDVVGVLVDKSARVRGLWASFATDNGRELVQDSRGISADLLAETLQIVQKGAAMRSLEAEFVPQSLAVARGIGLSDAWLQRIQLSNPAARQLLGVARLVAGSDAAQKLMSGDVLLTIDGKVVTRFRDVERAVVDKDQVQVTVWRVDGEKTLTVRTTALSGVDVDRIVEWAGATLQAPHRAISAQRSIEPRGVYVAYYAFGSPATRYGLSPGMRIVEVDGEATPDLDTFIRLVSGRADRTSLRIKTVGWNNAPAVITLKLDRHYWPSYELRRGADGWQRHSLE